MCIGERLILRDAIQEFASGESHFECTGTCDHGPIKISRKSSTVNLMDTHKTNSLINKKKCSCRFSPLNPRKAEITQGVRAAMAKEIEVFDYDFKIVIIGPQSKSLNLES